MIMVDVFVPVLDAEYDFSVSEETAIGVLIEEISEMICQREKLATISDAGSLMLCSVSGEALSVKGTLAQYGLTNGSRLLLV